MSVDIHPDRKLKTLETWLRCESASALSQLFAHADGVRHERFGIDTCSCGLVEISNNCRRRCLYCGLSLGNRTVIRYRMTVGEVMDSLAHVAELGCTEVILQGGEDGGLDRKDKVGSGVMVGLPGQNYVTLAQDVILFEELKLDMVSVDPFLPHPGTLLGQASLLEFDDQVPADIKMVHKVLALTRILCPDASILASMVFDVADSDEESPKALACGANVTVSNCTPPCSRMLYEAYPRVAMA